MNRIAELRKLNKISQLDFGKAMGVAQNTISQWERGAREPDLAMLHNIATYFGVSIDYLIGKDTEVRDMKNLKKLRVNRGLTQKQLADALGIDRTAVAKYETGKNGATAKMLKKIADYFSVSTDYVLGRDQEINYALLDGGERFRIDDATHREIMEFAGYAKEQKKAPSKDEAELEEFMQLYEQLSPEHRAILLAAAKGFAHEE